MLTWALHLRIRVCIQATLLTDAWGVFGDPDNDESSKMISSTLGYVPEESVPVLCVFVCWSVDLAPWGVCMRAQEDVHAVLQAGADYGADRLGHTADAQLGRLDPAEYLNPGALTACSI